MFYAVCNANGPISRRLAATTQAEAIAEFEAADSRAWVHEPATDAEDDLNIEGDGMTEAEFDEALCEAGGTVVCDLSPIHNYHAGTTAHALNGWILWQIDEVTSRSLDDLFADIKAGRVVLDDNLPAFADEAAELGTGVWSWDATRAIVGTCVDDIEIVPRSDI